MTSVVGDPVGTFIITVVGLKNLMIPHLFTVFKTSEMFCLISRNAVVAEVATNSELADKLNSAVDAFVTVKVESVVLNTPPILAKVIAVESN